MTAIQPQPAKPLPPDLMIPNGFVNLKVLMSTLVRIKTDEHEWMTAELPPGTIYRMIIREVYRARWRPTLGSESGVWSFWCRLGDDEFAWIEGDGLTQEWTINYTLSPPESLDGTQQTAALGS